MRQWQDFCNRWGLGTLLAEPGPVKGGWLHAMWQLHTTVGNFAVKVLNPEWSADPAWLERLERRERFARDLYQTGLQVVCAYVWQGRAVQPFRGHYYMVLPWVAGQIMTPDLVSTNHCAKLGKLLGQLHRATEPWSLEVVPSQVPFMAQQNRKQLAESAGRISHSSQRLVERWLQRLQNKAEPIAVHELPSHTDINPFNVLWHNDQPYLLDWELAAPIDPDQELLGVALEWSGLTQEYWRVEHFQALMQAYWQWRTPTKPGVEHALLEVIASWLDWFGFQMQRYEWGDGQGLEEARHALQAIMAIERHQRAIYALWLNGVSSTDN